MIINDSLDDNVIFLNSSPLYTGHSGNHYWWNVGDLNAGASGKITIDIKVKDNVPDSLDSIHNIYKINSANQTSSSTLETMVVSSLWIKKTADKTSYSPGDDVTYTILYGNEEDYTANSVNVTDVLPNVELLSVSPAPTSVNGNTLIWMINKTGYLGPLENGSIQLMVHIPERPELKFNEESSVRGQGYVYVNKRLSTVENNSLINKAYISGYYEKGPYRVWDNHSSTVTILGSAGTELSTYEHGSGYYKEDEQTSLRSKNHSISLNKDITAQHNNTSFSLPGGRS